MIAMTIAVTIKRMSAFERVVTCIGDYLSRSEISS